MVLVLMDAPSLERRMLEKCWNGAEIGLEKCRKRETLQVCAKFVGRDLEKATHFSIFAAENKACRGEGVLFNVK